MPYKFQVPDCEDVLLVTHHRFVADQILEIKPDWTSIHVSFYSREWKNMTRCSICPCLYKPYYELPEGIRDSLPRKSDMSKIYRTQGGGVLHWTGTRMRRLGILRRRKPRDGYEGGDVDDRSLSIVAWFVDLKNEHDKKGGTNELEVETSEDSWERKS